MGHLSLAAETVWAWHLGHTASRVEVDPTDPDGGFVSFGKLWDDDDWLSTVCTASLCVVGTQAISRRRGAALEVDPTEREIVGDALAWAALQEGSLAAVQTKTIAHAEIALRAAVESQLSEPRVNRAINTVAAALAATDRLDSAEIEELLLGRLPRGAGFSFEPYRELYALLKPGRIN